MSLPQSQRQFLSHAAGRTTRQPCPHGPLFKHLAGRAVSARAGAAYPLSDPNDANAATFDEDPLASFAEQRSKISAEIPVAAPPDVLWGVLTDYDAHTYLMPNLEQCERLPSRRPDTALLYQKVFSQTPFWRMEASAVLEVQESSALGWRKVKFRMVSGDFDELSGQWVVVPDSTDPQNSSILRYEIVLLPVSKALLPTSLRHFLLKKVFPGNILALATYAERLSQNRGGSLMDFLSAEQPNLVAADPDENQAPLDIANLPPNPQAPAPDRLIDPLDDPLAPGWVPNRRPMYLGVSSVPLPGQRQLEVPAAAAAAAAAAAPAGAAELPTERLRREAQEEAQLRGADAAAVPPYPPFPQAAGEAAAAAAADAAYQRVDSHPFSDTEVHIRKLDTDSKLHWRLLASVDVAADAAAIWAVLTNYAALGRVVPVISVSEEVPRTVSNRRRSGGRGGVAAPPPGLRRVRQVAAKRLPYVQLRTEVELDVLEKPGRAAEDAWELQFKQHRSDFDVLQGKWVIEPSPGGEPNRHSLKYAVELVVHARPFRFLGIMEPIIERGIVEDIPSSLAAIRRVAEGAARPRVAPERGRAAVARADRVFEQFEELRAELSAVYGERQQLPNRKELLASGRLDIINAISAFGGYTAVAEKMQWSVAKVTRRPRGYWGSLRNIQTELDLFNDEFDLPIGTVPKKSFLQKMSRWDIIKALERAGGSTEVAKMLEYTLASQQGERTPRAERPVGPDIGETEGRAVMQAAQRASSPAASQLTEGAALPTFAELLRETPSGEATPLAAAGDAARDVGADGRPLRASTGGEGPSVGSGAGYGPGVDAAAAMRDGAAMRYEDGKASREVQEVQARGALRRELRRKLDLNLRYVDWDGSSGRDASEGGWGYGGAAAAARGQSSLTEEELDNLLSDSEESTDSL
eukprot:jgi/Ulvmu1/12685/UM094_0042.1